MDTSSVSIRIKSRLPFLHQAADFWRWWTGELRDMLPGQIRSALLARVDRLYLHADDTELIASRSRGEIVEPIGRYPLTSPNESAADLRDLAGLSARSREVVLCLPATKVLHRCLTLPLATEENLYEVLGFEMDRQTPFSPAQVYYDYTVTGRDAKLNTLTLELVATPREYLDRLLAQLDAVGLQPHRATLARADDQTLPVNLLPASRRRTGGDATRYLNAALALLALLLLAAVIALPLFNRLNTIRSLEASIEVADARAEVTRRLDEQVRLLEADLQFLTRKKLAAPMVLDIVNELTHLLPDDTWINRLNISDGEVRIQGQSVAAASLIPLLESSAILRNPRFRSPVTRTPQGDAETFHLSAEIIGAPAHD